MWKQISTKTITNIIWAELGHCFVSFIGSQEIMLSILFMNLTFNLHT